MLELVLAILSPPFEISMERKSHLNDGEVNSHTAFLATNNKAGGVLDY